jgi:hypothetical protein
LIVGCVFLFFLLWLLSWWHPYFSMRYAPFISFCFFNTSTVQQTHTWSLFLISLFWCYDYLSWLMVYLVACVCLFERLIKTNTIAFIFITISPSKKTL